MSNSENRHHHDSCCEDWCDPFDPWSDPWSDPWCDPWNDPECDPFCEKNIIVNKSLVKKKFNINVELTFLTNSTFLI